MILWLPETRRYRPASGGLAVALPDGAGSDFLVLVFGRRRNAADIGVLLIALSLGLRPLWSCLALVILPLLAGR